MSKINNKGLIIGILFIIFSSGLGGWALRDYTLKDHGKFNGVILITDSNLTEELPKGIGDLNLSPQAALEIGNAVFRDTCGADFLKRTDFSVSEVKDKNIYIVSRVPKAPKGHIVLGGDLCLAIDKNTGQVLASWAGE